MNKLLKKPILISSDKIDESKKDVLLKDVIFRNFKIFKIVTLKLFFMFFLGILDCIFFVLLLKFDINIEKMYLWIMVGVYSLFVLLFGSIISRGLLNFILAYWSLSKIYFSKNIFENHKLNDLINKNVQFENLDLFVDKTEDKQLFNKINLLKITIIIFFVIAIVTLISSLVIMKVFL